VSKIFEILNKGNGEIADLIRPLVGAEPGVAQEARAEDRPAPGPLEGGAEQPAGQAPPAIAPSIGEVRTVNLHVRAPSPLLPFEDGQWLASEQYRILRTKISQHVRQPRLIVFSSPAAGDGKSVSAINTAGALSLKSGAQVLLLDADFRRSAVHIQLGIPEAPGLSEVLRGLCTAEEALVRAHELPTLCVMPAGASPANPAELLDSARWIALCAKLRKLFQYIVVDSPPVAAVADYELIQAVCDGVILVARPDQTPRPLLQKALDTVPKDKLLGVLINCVPDWLLAKHTGSDHYYHYSSTGAYASKI
jgi:capsular exopolysaccharide synthesis family protein